MTGLIIDHFIQLVISYFEITIFSKITLNADMYRDRRISLCSFPVIPGPKAIPLSDGFCSFLSFYSAFLE